MPSFVCRFDHKWHWIKISVNFIIIIILGTLCTNWSHTLKPTRFLQFISQTSYEKAQFPLSKVMNHCGFFFKCQNIFSALNLIVCNFFLFSKIKYNLRTNLYYKNHKFIIDLTFKYGFLIISNYQVSIYICF